MVDFWDNLISDMTELSLKSILFFFGCLLFTGIGGALLIHGAPRAGSDEAVAAAQQAQNEWERERSSNVIANRGWNGVPRPSDAPGVPAKPLPLVGGAFASLIAVWLGVRAWRHRQH